MAFLRRFTASIVPFLLLGSCAELIGLSDYDTGQASDEGGGGEDQTGGRGGTGQGGSGGVAAKPGVGGEDDGGNAGTLSTGGRISRGGTNGDGGMAGEPEGGTSGGPTGGSPPTGGSAGMAGASSGAGGAGNGGSGGSGGSPVCTEITLPTYVGAIVDGSLSPAVAAFVFEIDPELGGTFPDSFEIQFWDSGGAGSYDGAQNGPFMLGPPGDDSNYAFCSRCLIVYQDQDTSREKIFFQTEGALDLATTSDQMNGFPSWTFTDITLREVTIDADQLSTVVPGGECVHITTSSYTRESPSNWTCNLAWYSDNDCDCGCGQLDPTCTGSSSAACTYCWCNAVGTCTPNEVIASSNWLCN